MTVNVWTEATRDAIDAVTVTASPDNGATPTPDLVIVAMTTSGPGPDRVAQYAEATRHLTPTTARVLAAQLTAAADMIERATLWRVQLADPEHNTADTIVSARSPEEAGRLAEATVADYHADGWDPGPWRVNRRNRDAVVPIAIDPPRVHAVMPDWT